MKTTMRIMKKYALLLLAALTIVSCSMDDDDDVNYHFEFVGTETVDFPTEIHVNETYDVTINYRLPSNCYYISGIDYNYTGEYERFVALVSRVYNTAGCETNDTPETEVFQFRPTKEGTYTFHFLTDVEEDGTYTYDSYDITVSP